MAKEIIAPKRLPYLKILKVRKLLADKRYDTNYIVEAAENMGAMVVIPPKKNRIVQRKYDKDLYKERNIAERLFNKLKRF